MNANLGNLFSRLGARLASAWQFLATHGKSARASLAARLAPVRGRLRALGTRLASRLSAWGVPPRVADGARRLKGRLFPDVGAAAPAARVVLLLVLSVAAITVWAAVADVEQLARAPGQAIAGSRTQIVQAAIDGVIEDIPVREGQRVVRDQTIARLERAQAEAAVSDSRAKVAALKANLARLHAEVFGRRLAFPEETRDFPAFVANQTELFERRQWALNEELRALNTMLDAVKEELSLTEPLLGTGDIAKVEVIRLRKAAAELQGQISNRRNKYFQDAQADMTKAEEDLATQEQVLAERLIRFGHTQLRAPTDGIVRNIRLTTRGASVRPGEVVMELFPTDSEMVVEAKLKPADVAFVRTGLPAAVKLDAYDYSIYGMLRGEVSFVSPDALTENTAAGEHIYYRVQIRITDLSSLKTKSGKAIEIQPGMTAQVDIRTGEQSVLSYLAKPVIKTLSESFRER